jgi:hypothetical protein
MNFDFQSAESSEIALNHSSPKYTRQLTTPASNLRLNNNSSGYSSNSISYSPQYSENIERLNDNQENILDYSSWLNSYNPFDFYTHIENRSFDENLFINDEDYFFT